MEGPVQQHPFIDATKRLLEMLRGRWVSLALHHIGHHIVKKLFHSLVSMEDKEALASELSKGIVRLNSKPSGRDVIVECAVKDFLESKASWTAAITKRTTKARVVNEIGKVDSEDGDLFNRKKRKHKKARVTDNY